MGLEDQHKGGLSGFPVSPFANRDQTHGDGVDRGDGRWGKGTPSCTGSLAPHCGLQCALGWEGEAKGAEDAKLSSCHTVP